LERSAYSAFVGETFGNRYRIEAILGSGRMAGVFRAIDTWTNTLVALKMLDPVLLSDPELRDELITRFQREIDTTLTLGHPNIARLLDTGTFEGDKLYLVMELLNGYELEAYLGQPVRSTWVSYVAQQVASALGEAHHHGIVHRDLKPANVLLTERYGLKDVAMVVDFGIARMLETHHEVTNVTKTGATVGTPQYMAPEQATSEPISPQTDLYALGCIIYELLTGKQVFYADTAWMVAMAHVNEPVPRLEVPGMPPQELQQWQALLDELLAKAPDARPASASAVIKSLRRITPDVGDAMARVRRGEESRPRVSQKTMAGSGGQKRRTKGSKRRMWVAAIATIAAIGAAVAVFALK